MPLFRHTAFARLPFARTVIAALAASFFLGQLCSRAENSNKTLFELIDVLAKNGQITAEQAETLKRSAAPAPDPVATKAVNKTPEPVSAPKVVAIPKIKEVTRLVIGGKVHAQWDALSTDTDGGPKLAARNNFLMRRIQIDATGDLGPEWSGRLIGDFAASSLIDQAYIAYKGIPSHELRIGHAKVPFLWEETLPFDNVKGVERSASYRAVVEQAGRSIGSKNTGMHLRGGGTEGPYYAIAITNAASKNVTGVAGNVTNSLAYWGRVGTNLAFANGRLDVSVDAGYLPDFLPAGAVSAFATHAHYQGRDFDVLTELVSASYARAGKPDANLVGFMIEPAFRFAEKWEAVLRFSSVDSGGIGVSPGSLIRGAPDSGDFDRVDSYYVGGNYYFIGDSLKLMFGYEHAKATNPVSGPSKENTIDGIRTRLQVLF